MTVNINLNKENTLGNYASFSRFLMGGVIKWCLNNHSNILKAFTDVLLSQH